MESIRISSKKTTARMLSHESHAPETARRRLRRLDEHPAVGSTREVVATKKQAFLKDPSLEHLDKLQNARRKAKPVQREFENSKARLKDLHHARHQKVIAISHTAAMTRQFVKSCK